MPITGARKMELKQKLRARMQKIRDSNDVTKMSARGLLMRRNMSLSERKLTVARCVTESRKELLDKALIPENLSDAELNRLMNMVATRSK